MSGPRITPALSDLVRPIEQFTADPANLRNHGERSIEAIKASLLRFGQQRPILVDENGVVVAGNGTLEAARRLGWTHIAATTSDLGGAERVGYSIADNRIAELAAWHIEPLGATLSAMPQDLRDVTGFTDEELAALLPPDPQPVNSSTQSEIDKKVVCCPKCGTKFTAGYDEQPEIIEDPR